MIADAGISSQQSTQTLGLGATSAMSGSGSDGGPSAPLELALPPLLRFTGLALFVVVFFALALFPVGLFVSVRRPVATRLRAARRTCLGLAGFGHFAALSHGATPPKCLAWWESAAEMIAARRRWDLLGSPCWATFFPRIGDLDRSGLRDTRPGARRRPQGPPCCFCGRCASGRCCARELFVRAV